jgi:hypothetical protein
LAFPPTPPGANVYGDAGLYGLYAGTTGVVDTDADADPDDEPEAEAEEEAWGNACPCTAAAWSCAWYALCSQDGVDDEVGGVGRPLGVPTDVPKEGTDVGGTAALNEAAWRMYGFARADEPCAAGPIFVCAPVGVGGPPALDGEYAVVEDEDPRLDNVGVDAALGVFLKLGSGGAMPLADAARRAEILLDDAEVVGSDDEELEEGSGGLREGSEGVGGFDRSLFTCAEDDEGRGGGGTRTEFDFFAGDALTLGFFLELDP